MEEIGLFPLEMVLLPTERVPLHVFEPRYRELVGECIATESEFGLVLADGDGLREIGTRAAVTELLEEFDDGRMNVVVEGRGRFRVVALTEGRSFQTAEVEPVDDDGPEPDEADVERALGLVHRLGELAGADVDDLAVTTGAPSFELAGHVAFEPRLKQELLELRSEPERLGRLARMLEQAARMLEFQRAGAEIASTNGKLPTRRRRPR